MTMRSWRLLIRALEVLVAGGIFEGIFERCSICGDGAQSPPCATESCPSQSRLELPVLSHFVQTTRNIPVPRGRCVFLGPRRSTVSSIESYEARRNHSRPVLMRKWFAAVAHRLLLESSRLGWFPAKSRRGHIRASSCTSCTPESPQLEADRERGTPRLPTRVSCFGGACVRSISYPGQLTISR